MFRLRCKVEVFPAWAGVILAFVLDTTSRVSIPRVGGGKPEFVADTDDNFWYSPHGRGDSFRICEIGYFYQWNDP